MVSGNPKSGLHPCEANKSQFLLLNFSKGYILPLLLRDSCPRRNSSPETYCVLITFLGPMLWTHRILVSLLGTWNQDSSFPPFPFLSGFIAGGGNRSLLWESQLTIMTDQSRLMTGPDPSPEGINWVIFPIYELWSAQTESRVPACALPWGLVFSTRPVISSPTPHFLSKLGIDLPSWQIKPKQANPRPLSLSLLLPDSLSM